MFVTAVCRVTELPDRVFAEASTCHQWRHRGDEFYKHHLYNVAAKCYMKSGDLDKEKMSRAQQRALEASRLRDNPRRLRHEFLFAAEGYLECGMTVEAAKCLCNAKETLLAARLYEKMGQVGSLHIQTCAPSVFFRICYGIQPRIRKYRFVILVTETLIS